MKRFLRIMIWLVSVLLCAGPGGFLIVAGAIGLPMSAAYGILGYQGLDSDPQAESGMYAGLLTGGLYLSMICIGGLLTLVPLWISSVSKRLLHLEDPGSRGVETGSKPGFWKILAAFLLFLICCVLAGLGGLYFYSTQ